MRRTRYASSAVLATLLTLVTLTGCSDGDDEPTDDTPSSAQPSPTPADKADAAGVKAALRDYYRALEGFNREREVTPELAAVTTEAWADQLLTTYEDNLFSNGMEMTGRWRAVSQTVNVAGDSAEARVCSDGSEVYVVDSGEGVTEDSQSQGRRRAVVSLVRADDGWKVDGLVTEEGAC